MAEIWPSNEAGWARRILRDIVERLERAKAAGVFDVDDAESEIVSIRRRLKNAKLSKRTPAGKAWAEFLDAVKYFSREADADLASHLRDELWEMVEVYQASKREAGCLDFTDLLLYARELLRHDGARPELQARYDRLFVDEFQDTDPLQAEILTTLASSGDICLSWAIPSNRSIGSGARSRGCTRTCGQRLLASGADEQKLRRATGLQSRSRRSSMRHSKRAFRGTCRSREVRRVRRVSPR